MISTNKKEILIDGKPTLILSAEIHYFRLRPDEWEDRIDKAIDSGYNAIATYIPWFFHELIEDRYDFTGETYDKLNLIKFLELVESKGLYFIARPGPFIMAEVKNEGIPDWVYEKYPDVQGVTWNSNEVTTATVDYLHEGFLKEAKDWYKEILAVLKPYQLKNDGNLIAIQLDNEIGMLSWVSNCPVLNEERIRDMYEFAIENEENLPFELPETLRDKERFISEAMTPSEELSLPYHYILGVYYREVYSRYSDILADAALAEGMDDVLFMINIHGTGGGRGLSYPIGLAQLYTSFPNKKNFISGTDIYLGDITNASYQDLYILNEMTDAVNDEDQPLTSLEFECGTSDYGERLARRNSPAAADLKARLTLAQGGKLLNYYLFTGGYNTRIEEYDREDGNNRIAITGERHGFAAPVNPEGVMTYSYDRNKQGLHVYSANADTLSRTVPEYDDLSLAFLPDYFMTEYHYPESDLRNQQVENLNMWRASQPWDSFLKGILASNYRFDAFDLQKTTPGSEKVILLPSASYMSADVQQRVVDHVESGGNLFLYGNLPEFDLAGNECTILIDYLGLTAGENVYSTHHYRPSVKYLGGEIEQAEIHVGRYQKFTTGEESTEILLESFEGQDSVAALIKHLPGRAVVMTTEYTAHTHFFRHLLELLDCRPKYEISDPHQGTIILRTENEDGAVLHHIFNFDQFSKRLEITYKEQGIIGGGSLHIAGETAVILPENLQIKGAKLLWSTCEIIDRQEGEISFLASKQRNKICVDSIENILNIDEVEVVEKGGVFELSPNRKWFMQLLDVDADELAWSIRWKN